MDQQEKEPPKVATIGFGEGRVMVAAVYSDDSVGVVFRDTGEQHDIGPDTPGRGSDYEIRPFDLMDGDLLFQFKNAASCRVLIAALTEALEELTLREGNA